MAHFLDLRQTGDDDTQVKLDVYMNNGGYLILKLDEEDSSLEPKWIKDQGPESTMDIGTGRHFYKTSGQGKSRVKVAPHGAGGSQPRKPTHILRKARERLDTEVFGRCRSIQTCRVRNQVPKEDSPNKSHMTRFGLRNQRF